VRRPSSVGWLVGWSLAAALVLAAPALAHAEGEAAAEHATAEHEAADHGAADHEGAGDAAEHAPKLDLGKLGLQLLNFAVLAGILGWFGGKAINKALVTRHDQLKADLVAASEARASAERRAAEQETRLDSLETEIAGIRAGIKQEAEAEKQKLIAAAEERSKRIGEETKFLLDQQVKEAEASLRREVAEAAVKIAEQLVTRSFVAADQQRLVDTFVNDASLPPGRTS
jgi:F-type H+-transporting ATPase subunit b